MNPHGFRSHIQRIVLLLALLSSLGICCAERSEAAGTFISAPNRVDMVHDKNRNILYISSGSDVLRYDLATQKFLSPYQLGGSLKGMDLSPDGTTLAVADTATADGHSWIHLINLATGTSSKIIIQTGIYEGGTFSVAFGNDGTILITSTFNGSGWVPLRRYDPATGTITILNSSISQDTMLSPSADGSMIGFAESNISDGSWGRYRVSDGNMVERTGYTDGTSWFNYEIGTNRTGNQFAIPTYGGTYIYDANFSRIATLGQYAGPQPIGVVFHPTKDIAYFAWAQTTEVRAFETATYTQVGTYNFENDFQSTGNTAFIQGRLKISRDGALLFATVANGIRYVNLNGVEQLVAYDQAIQSDEDKPVAITLKADSPVGARLSYHILTAPQHGTLTGDAPNLTYVPDTNFNGSDSFTFNANDSSQDSNTATVTIGVSPVNDQPIARNDVAYALFGSSIVINALANDGDVDGDQLYITNVTHPRCGSVAVLQDGRLRYVAGVPSRRVKSCSDMFVYTISDDQGGTATANVTVNLRWK